MRHQTTWAIAAAALGLTVAACTEVPQSNERLEEAQRGVHQRIKLDGCLRPGANAGAYMLENVVEPPPATQPEGQDLMQTGPIVAKGGRARLTGDADMLQAHLGERVEVIGRVVDRGDNTLDGGGPNAAGATGTAGIARPESTPPQSSVSNARRPLIAIERMKTLASACDGS